MSEPRTKFQWLVNFLIIGCLPMVAMPIVYVACYLCRTERQENRFGGTIVLFQSEREARFFRPARRVEAWLLRDSNGGFGWRNE